MARKQKLEMSRADFDLFAADSETKASNQVCQTSCNMTSHLVTSDTLKAEVIWTLNVIDKHYSFTSCAENSQIFACMFPDSHIAKQYACGDRKTAYLSTFGLAPYFTSLLNKKIKSEHNYVLLFDESLNEELQKKQLDVLVRLWDVNCVKTFYYTSHFLGHATANDVFDCLEGSLIEFGMNKVLQISMDGPNVNWKVYDMIEKQIGLRNGTQKLLNIGSCGLHTIHNSFRTGFNKTGWDIEHLLGSLFHLFDNAPARQEDFVKVTGSHCLPLQFCNHRWLENTKAAERAILILPNIVTYCKAAASKTVVEPTNKSFAIVQKAIQDDLISAKLHFFLTISKEFEPFLSTYQTDAPMIAFIAYDLGLLLKNLMAKFVKAEVLQEIQSLSALIKLDVENKSIWMDSGKIDVGFSANKILVKTNSGSDSQKAQFKIQCRDCLVAICKKMMEKSPLRYPLVRLLSWLDPRQMSKPCERDHNVTKLRKCLQIITDCGKVKEAACDSIMQQFSMFIDTTCMSDIQFRNFDFATDRLDKLLYLTMSSRKDLSDLWSFVRTVLLLSHGQATVERGFSVNKELSTDNMKEHTLVARRIIVDSIRKAGSVVDVPVTKEMLTFASAARSKYQSYLDDRKKEEAAASTNLKRKEMEGKLNDLSVKRARLEEDITGLSKSADDLAERAENEGVLTLLSQSNALRKRLKEKQALLKQTSEDINKTKALL